MRRDCCRRVVVSWAGHPVTGRLMRDAATLPTPFRPKPGELWAGYLDSPTATRPWTGHQLRAAAGAGGLLPVYVAPLTYTGTHTPHADADHAMEQLRALSLSPLVVALDTEQRAYDSAPAAAIDYAAAFNAQLVAHGAHPVHYGGRSFLTALRGHIHRGHAWLAWWTDPSTASWPLETWPAPHAWQYSDRGKYHRHRVDLSRVDPGFPLSRRAPTTPPVRPGPAPQPTPAPAPAPAPAPGWQLTVHHHPDGTTTSSARGHVPALTLTLEG